jgi:hypothetical protein
MAGSPLWLTEKGSHVIQNDKRSLDGMDRVLLGLVDGQRGRADLVKRLGHPALARIDRLIAEGLIGEPDPSAPQDAAGASSVTPVALEVFTRFYGDAGVSMVHDLLARAEPDASPARIARLCADALAPLTGAEIADGYFKPFY